MGPGEFMSVADETGHIIPIGLWVIEEVCRQLKRWESAGVPLPRVAINIAPVHFHQPDFHDALRTMLQSHSVDPALIELELAESSLIQDPDGTRECLKALKSIGVRLAIDEFGAGYSCLKYLRQFPMDVLKIDRSFVSDVDTNRDAQVLCSAILSIASLVARRCCRWHRVGGAGVVLDEKRLPIRPGQLLQRADRCRSDRRFDGQEWRTSHSTPPSHEPTHRREGRMRGEYDPRQHPSHDARRSAARVGRSRSEAAQP